MLQLDERIAKLQAAVKDFDSKKAAYNWSPHKPHPKQLEFLALDTEEALYGGAAGGGKSDALLMAALRHVDVPGYEALILRRTYLDLALPKALMDRAAEWLRPTAARWDETHHRWTFPSGARLSFGYLEGKNDKYRYQSAEFQFIAFDELTQFEEDQYTYLLTRLRRVEGFPIMPIMRAASNPGGVGHEWVKARFVDPGLPGCPFVPALLADNPTADATAYRRMLARVNQITRNQLEHGIWEQATNGLVYPLFAHNLVDKVESRYPLTHILACDLGAGKSGPTTAFGVLGWQPYAPTVWMLESGAFPDMIPSDIATTFEAYQAEYNPMAIVVDEGGLGKGYGEEFRRRWSLPVRPAEKKDKLGNRKLLNGALERGEVRIVERANRELIKEMRSLPWDKFRLDAEKGRPDHLTDMLLYGWRACLAYHPSTEEKRYEPGTDAWWNAEAERQEKEEVRRLRERAELPWYSR